MAKLIYTIKRRNYLIAIYAVLMGIIVGVGMTGATGVNEIINTSEGAKRRLIPAVITAELNETIFENRLFIEEHITEVSKAKYASIEKKIKDNRLKIDSLMTLYSDTYGNTSQENNLLRYRNALRQYQSLEQIVLSLSRRGEKQQALVLFLGQSYKKFKDITEPIKRMTELHVEEGELKYEEAKRQATRVKFILYMSIAVATLISIAVGAYAGFKYMYG
ncbi:MAG: MCP four helix bundle domain-containing protein [Microscillaceae bacterium]|nr:MCP four helix bundle domain-containing protein [Microscillaceae bacterium]MDW8461454.1 MCP four helix bundle domain-containing protein [Cytophagales bacterium]